MRRTLRLWVAMGVFAVLAARGGAWGTGSFENDEAMDWIQGDLVRQGVPAVSAVLRAVTKAQGVPEASRCSEAIAACELLAAGLGKPAADLPKEAVQAAKAIPKPPEAALLREARQTLDAILKRSELKESWSATPDFEAWKKKIEALKARLTP